VTLGKKLDVGDEVTAVHGLQTKKGNYLDLGKGLYDYTSKLKNTTDTLLYIIRVDYNTLGIQTLDTTRYIIKLNEKFKGETIQNLLTPNNDGQNDYWVLPISMLEDYPRMQLQVMSLDGKIVYRTTSTYQNDWNADGLSTGIYLYEIVLEPNNILKGMLKVERE